MRTLPRREAGRGFRLATEEKGQRDNYCRPCRAAYKQEHYAANRSRYVEQAIARKKALVLARAELLIEFFQDHPCVDCGERDPVVLAFDHLCEKEFSIAKGLATAIGRPCSTRLQSATWFVQTVTGDVPPVGAGSHVRW